jgi:hypothetical protein
VNVNVRAEALPAVEESIVKLVVVSPTSCISGELVMFVGGMSSIPARVIATVRVVKFASCATSGALSPVEIVIVHAAAARSVAVATVNSKFAFAVPKLETAPVKVAVPHPDVAPTIGAPADPDK